MAFENNIAAIIINRPLINPKFICALLSSRYYFHQYFHAKRKNDISSNLSLAEIELIEIPILPIEKQELLGLIYDYKSKCQIGSKQALFFERLMDAMVYEVFFLEQFLEWNLKIEENISIIKKLDDLEDIDKKATIENVYSILSSPEHQIGAELIKLMNIPSVRNIENNF